MSNTAEMTVMPQCNFCERVAEYDAATLFGPWAYVCTPHWFEHTNQQLGTGYGQRLVLIKE